MQREAIEITVERKHFGLLLTTIFNGTYYKLKIADHFNVKRAKTEFRKYVREEEAKLIRSK
jgi:hypothetical protein